TVKSDIIDVQTRPIIGTRGPLPSTHRVIAGRDEHTIALTAPCLQYRLTNATALIDGLYKFDHLRDVMNICENDMGSGAATVVTTVQGDDRKTHDFIIEETPQSISNPNRVEDATLTADPG